MMLAMSVTLYENWCHTTTGSPVPLYTSSATLPTEQKNGGVLWIGGVHGDEPEGVELALSTLQWLKSHTQKMFWSLIPCLNPDGVVLRQRTNARGVDLNRNYPSKDWSAVARAPRYHPGPCPNSEPEIQALVKLIQEQKPHVIVHCHSWKPSIVCAGPEALRLGQHFSDSTGYPLLDDIGYPTPGSLSQYAWQDLGIPVVCIEEKERIHLSTVWPRFKTGVENFFKDLVTRVGT
jgi:murein peptide amidase A